MTQARSIWSLIAACALSRRRRLVLHTQPSDPKISSSSDPRDHDRWQSRIPRLFEPESEYLLQRRDATIATTQAGDARSLRLSPKAAGYIGKTLGQKLTL